MTIKKDENVLAGKKTPSVIPIKTEATVTNAQTGKKYASEDEAQADVKTLQLPQKKNTSNAMSL